MTKVKTVFISPQDSHKQKSHGYAKLLVIDMMRSVLFLLVHRFIHPFRVVYFVGFPNSVFLHPSYFVRPYF